MNTAAARGRQSGFTLVTASQFHDNICSIFSFSFDKKTYIIKCLAVVLKVPHQLILMYLFR